MMIPYPIERCARSYVVKAEVGTSDRWSFKSYWILDVFYDRWCQSTPQRIKSYHVHASRNHQKSDMRSPLRKSSLLQHHYSLNLKLKIQINAWEENIYPDCLQVEKNTWPSRQPCFGISWYKFWDLTAIFYGILIFVSTRQCPQKSHGGPRMRRKAPKRRY